MKQIYTTLLLGTLAFTACGGGGSSTTTPIEESTPSEELAPATIQKYTIDAVPTSGGNCKGATGDMLINGSVVSGTVTTGWGDILIISGTYLPSNGDLSGGFAKNNIRVAEYSGNISNNTATGTWSDSLGCSGTWRGVGDTSNYVPTPTTQTPTTQTPVTPIPVTPTPASNIVSSDGITFDPYNLQGYTLSYNQLSLDYYNIKVNCDGSYEVTLTRRGLTTPVDSGDIIDVSNDELSFGTLNRFSLIDGNLVVGESKNLIFGSTLSSVTQTDTCN
jgi:hypothetical protein